MNKHFPHPFNAISAIVFALMSIVTFFAGFFNPTHFIICLAMVNLTSMALYDDSYGTSIIDWFCQRQ